MNNEISLAMNQLKTVPKKSQNVILNIWSAS
jgi:hypothetical protein